MLAGFAAVTATLTTRCSFGCSYCPQRRSGVRRMDGKTVSDAARLAADSGFPHPRLTLTGGEPLLDPDLVRKAASDLRTHVGRAPRPSLRLFTNGAHLDQETALFLAGEDADLTISFDGVSSAQDFRSPGSGSVLERNLLDAAAAAPRWFGMRVGARITLHSGNVRFLADSVRLLAGLGLRRIDAGPVVTPDAGWDRAAADELDRRLEEIAAAERPVLTDEAPTFRPFAARSQRRTVGAICGLGSPDTLFLDVDGSVAPCGAMVPSLLGDPPALVREAVATLAGPSVHTGELRGAMLARARLATRLTFARDLSRKRSPHGPCASCEALSECFVCPASIAFAPEQDPNLVPAIQCDWNRLVAKHRRAFLARLASRGSDPQRAGSSSSAAATSAVTPARIDGA